MHIVALLALVESNGCFKLALISCVQDLANPTALLLSAVAMLRHLKLHDKADRIQDAIINTISEGKYRTADLGGKSTTTGFTRAIIDHL